MAGLVDHLGGAVVLRLDPRHGLNEPGCAQQGALLSVEELAEGGGLGVEGELHPLVFVPRGDGGALDVEQAAGRHASWDAGRFGLEADHALGVDGGRPVEIVADVPL